MTNLRFSKSSIGFGESITRFVQLADDEIGMEVPEVKFLQPIEGKIQFLRLSEGFSFKGKVQTSIEIPCRRCLILYPAQLKVLFDLCFSNDADLAARTTDEEIIDLTEDLKQIIALEIPCWPLCQNTCQGLCVSCGCNLNSQNCYCEANLTSTSPFDNLKNMLQSAGPDTDN